MPDLPPDPDSTLPTLDRECMAAMWEDAGPALFQRLAGLFETERQQRADKLQAALRADDRQAIALEAHSLKTAAAYICAAGLRERARRLERDAPSAAADLLRCLVEDLTAESDHAARQLAAAIHSKNNE